MKKRFIAGAACPSCQQRDTLRVWRENNIDKVECVSCDYHDSRLPESAQQSHSGAESAENVIGIFKPE
ncbi:DNA-binding protein [Salinivibrio sp. MA351]|uniref:YheV family putative zinc ribbon protein n=1 Tax=Salinivibrio TaxID=51366 RepID=UPI000470825F|nr:MULTISPECIES: YheV family putative zinc ribbon protein [Salinivibrio]NUY55255.1 YheV family putative metal-binding protein [Salinivibrio sp. EAGSL]OOE89912.1 DNA-binding protein [Salinivibrio sp. AR640]OOE91245.1 DNA-binding protein [Salinivibrio sp. AR647]OOF00812.1 DNA-binding protein [Salinivibrio sp. MA351]OOF03690.1 DNA-binding protein [Salinivibrio sp. MA440]